jgi:serine protease Do
MKKTPTFLSILLIFTFMVISACGITSLGLTNGFTAGNPPESNSVTQAKASPTPQTQVVAPIPPPSGLLSGFESTLENIYTQVNPSVVNIQVVQQQTTPNQQSPSPFFSFPGIPNSPNPQTPQFGEALGSGFVWDKNGDIVTNDHVVEGADNIQVTFWDGTTFAANLVGADPDSDLAVVKVDVSADKLNPVSVSDSTQVKVGQLAVAIGNPFGLQNTMTEGIISAVGRSLPANDTSQNGLNYTIPDVIQTDAPINPGNSGGVLVNDQGQLIGVTSAIESPVQANSGVGFVIPSAIVQKVVPALIESGHYDHPYLGISGRDMTPDLAKAMNLSADQRGALVEDVTPGTPADKAGLVGSTRQVTIFGQAVNVGGDVITAIDGKPVNNMLDLIAYLADQTQVGQKVTLKVLRNGKEVSVDVTLGARPSQGGSAQGTQTGTAWLGILGATVTPEIAQAMGLPSDQQGVLVQQVESGSPADLAGLLGSFKPLTINNQQVLIGGDIITAIDGQTVSQVEELSTIIQQSGPGQQVRVSILRNGNAMNVQVTLAEQPTQSP